MEPDMSLHSQDAGFMQMALEMAAQAAASGEVPVGAVVVRDGQVIGVGRNSPIGSVDPSAHAEVNALRAAAKAVGNYRLEDCTLYVTLEPCAMCCGAILHARLKRVVFGAADKKTGCAGSILNLFSNAQLNHQTLVDGGVSAGQACAGLQQFFQSRREVQRNNAIPLREDALRTPDACFGSLQDYPWQPRFISDLPVLNGLRMHFLDEGASDAARVLLCVHPVPGWSYAFHAQIPVWVGEGARVIAPDLIGFGKSDKPKRPEFHNLEFHLQSLLQLLDHLDIRQVTLVVTTWESLFVRHLLAGLSQRVVDKIDFSLLESMNHDDNHAGLESPYPDAGYRAAERAFAAPTFVNR